jgi:hypothetical protein
MNWPMKVVPAVCVVLLGLLAFSAGSTIRSIAFCAWSLALADAGSRSFAQPAGLEQRAVQRVARALEERIELREHAAEVLFAQHEALRERLAHAEHAGAAQRRAGGQRGEKSASIES